MTGLGYIQYNEPMTGANHPQGAPAHADTLNRALRDYITATGGNPDGARNTFRAPGTLSLVSQGAVGDGTTDDTTAINNFLAVCPDYSDIDGAGKTYRITGPLLFKPGSRYITLKNLILSVDGDVEAVAGSDPASTIISFFTLENCLIICSGHSTLGRKAVNFQCFSQSTFRNVWVLGVDGITYAFYGIKNTAGSGPYYNLFEKIYAGGFAVGWYADDTGFSAGGVNTTFLIAARLQPSTGNTGLKITRYCQGIAVWGGIFESPGGIGVDVDGIGCSFLCARYEGLTKGMAWGTHAIDNWSAGHLRDSLAGPDTYAGSSKSQNMIFGDDNGGAQALFWPGAATIGSTVTATGYKVGANQVIGARGASVADAAGGAVIDVEARASLNALLARVRASTGHGLIS